MSSACTVWFYSPARDRVTGLNVINKLVAGLDPPFCHVELQFPSGEACSIVMQGAVSLRARTFDGEFYTGVVVRADAAAVGKALGLARGHVAAGTGFGVLGGRTFCSKLVAELLCESGMVARAELAASRLVTPSSLFRMLQLRQVVVQPLAAICFRGGAGELSAVERGAGERAGERAGESVAGERGAGERGAAPVGFLHALSLAPEMSSSFLFARRAMGRSAARKENVPEDRRLLLGA